MQGSIFRGAGYLLAGIKLLKLPGVRRYVFIPLLINILLFSLLIYFSYQQFTQWLTLISGWLPDWLAFLDWLLWLFFALTMLLLVFFSFSLVANLIASPFNGFLAAAVQSHIAGTPPPDSGRSLAAEIPHALRRELSKLGYYLPRVGLLFVMSFIPLLTPFAPILWFLLGVWMMSIQYIDYPMDNNHIDFAGMRALMQQQRMTAMGFGAVTLFATMIPLVNLFIIPAAVAGATLFWVRESQPLITQQGLAEQGLAKKDLAKTELAQQDTESKN